MKLEKFGERRKITFEVNHTFDIDRVNRRENIFKGISEGDIINDGSYDELLLKKSSWELKMIRVGNSLNKKEPPIIFMKRNIYDYSSSADMYTTQGDFEIIGKSNANYHLYLSKLKEAGMLEQ
ncbi:MAG: hypothetical protein AABW50_00220 [Nanoarchaeota archaeon]